MINTSVNELVGISRKFGNDKSYVLAGGGNTSVKDEGRLWVKASGVSLATIDENGFVSLSREKLKVISAKNYSNDSLQRENEVKNDLAAAILSPDHLRPSVETSLHDIIDYKFVVHTHPTKVNGVMCAVNARLVCNELFGDEVLFIEYTDPGYVLFKKVETEIVRYKSRMGSAPKIIFLENHGVFVGADSVTEIESLYQRIIERINSKIKTELPDSMNEPIEFRSLEVIRQLHPGFAAFQAIIATNRLIDMFVVDNESFAKADRAFTPDDIVYCKAYYLFLEQNENHVQWLEQAKAKVEAFRIERGYLPKVLALEGEGIVAVEESVKSALNVLEVFENILKISFYSENFGGPKFMTPEQIDFIDNWEVENYRRKVAKS
jgi:rhamnose utilization protein RhaD (predicted bifunctional aldolase and dehydrogenase)